MRGKYFLNHKGNVPELSPKDENRLIVILVILFLFTMGLLIKFI